MLKSFFITLALFVAGNASASIQFSHLLGKHIDSPEVKEFVKTHWGIDDPSKLKWRDLKYGDNMKRAGGYHSSSKKYIFPIELNTENDVVESIKVFGPSLVVKKLRKDEKWLAFWSSEMEGGITFDMTFEQLDGGFEKDGATAYLKALEGNARVSVKQFKKAKTINRLSYYTSNS